MKSRMEEMGREWADIQQSEEQMQAWQLKARLMNSQQGEPDAVQKVAALIKTMRKLVQN